MGETLPENQPVARGPTWIPVGSGRIAVGHRPRLRSIRWLPSAGCDRVVTILSDREGAGEIGALVREAGMTWTWFPLGDARPPQGHRVQDRARTALREISLALDAGESVLVHCSAGLHRTGMIVYALLRCRGATREQALDVLEQLRPMIRTEVTEERLAWADQVAC